MTSLTKNPQPATTKIFSLQTTKLAESFERLNSFLALTAQEISFATAGFFSLDLGFCCFIWGSEAFIENLGVFDSGQFLDFSLKNTVVS